MNVYTVTKRNNKEEETYIDEVFFDERLAEQYVKMQEKYNYECQDGKLEFYIEECEIVDAEKLVSFQPYYEVEIDFYNDCRISVNFIRTTVFSVEEKTSWYRKNPIIWKHPHKDNIIRARFCQIINEVNEDLDMYMEKLAQYLQCLSLGLEEYCKDIPINEVKKRLDTIRTYLEVNFKLEI